MRRIKMGINAALVGTTGYRLVSAQPKVPTNGRVKGGLVEEFDVRRVNGWVVVPSGADPVRVGLYVNGTEVATTWATAGADSDGADEMRSFDFTLRDLWTYCKTRYQLSVHAAGTALPIRGHGMFLAPREDGRSNLTTIRSKLADGHVFGQTGRLQLSKRLDTAWQANVMRLYADVRRIVADRFDYEVFLAYGTLLGAVREGGVIGHDVDFDAAFVSRHGDGHSAAAELREIAFHLIERGLDVEGKRTALHIHAPDAYATKIDLFHLYFDDSGTLQFPFGVAGITEISTADWQGTREIDFCGDRALVPVNAEQVVEHVYGAGWRSPKPGFDWGRDRTKRDLTGLLPPSYGEEVYWTNFYMRSEPRPGSPFFEAVNARRETPRLVIDIGCGDGRDALAFGDSGRTVLGLDRSEVAVRHATERAAELNLGPDVSFATCDLADAAAFGSLVASFRGEAGQRVLFYMRFLLHSLPADVQDTLMAAIAECARTGDILAAEFRTDQDEGLDKAIKTKHYRRYQNGPAFGASLRERFGFAILEEREGRGLSPFGDEDPHLYRVIAQQS